MCTLPTEYCLEIDQCGHNLDCYTLRNWCTTYESGHAESTIAYSFYEELLIILSDIFDPLVLVPHNAIFLEWFVTYL